ncbi:MAG: voltage-gated chloride channel [Elusimicrobia bacterium HGW-Elusimicrobia-2]|nr:MAG: voltage-gated chloride channel [Elusimicrobia bacterium HGW-Elusimicrobia-2]
MKKRLAESSILFISITKWVVLSSVIGLVVGLSTSLFLKLLEAASSFSGSYNYYFLALPAAMFLSALVIKLAPGAEGHGTEKVIEAVHKRSGKMSPAIVPVKLLATLLTITAGGSVGKEGPCAQIGGGLSSIIADLFHFDDRDRRKLVICGISAGFAAVFGAPVAGAIFGVEVLLVGGILYEVLLPSIIAGIVSYEIAVSMGVSYFYKHIDMAGRFTPAVLFQMFAAGIFFGLCATIFIEFLNRGKRAASKIPLSSPLKGFAGGLILIALTFVFSKQYLGLGLSTIEGALHGAKIVWYAFLVKIIFTSITLNMGGSGGIVTPLFFVGASAGTLFASLSGIDPGLGAAVGMVSVLAGAANTPIAAVILSMELFGAEVVPMCAVAAGVSFLMTGHRSVYPSQKIALNKSASIYVKHGETLEDIIPIAKIKLGSVTDRLLNIIKKIYEWRKKC